MHKLTINNTKLFLVKGDLTEQEVDAIVNAANSMLQHGGGVAGAIVRNGGNIIQEESDKIGYTPTGQAAITSSGALKAKYVIHAVGPIWKGGNQGERELLGSAVQNSLRLADEYQLNSIALPAISSGIFGFPKDQCAQVIVHAITDYLNEHDQTSIKEVRLVIFDELTYGFFESAIGSV